MGEVLNAQQREAVEHGDTPLLVIAGAGSGKTKTLSCRVASLIGRGADPRRILLLTFSRRAAVDMKRRAQHIVRAEQPRSPELSWAGTFHAVANRLLRLYAEVVGLDPAFTVLDRSDSADLMDVLRSRLELAKTHRRFPKKATCQSIYSRVVNTQSPIGDVLEAAFPWCQEWQDELKKLFAAFTEEKQSRHTLDYDDLLLYWFHLMGEPEVARSIGGMFDHVMVDEYQDTNALQEQVLLALKPTGAGVTVVGDDAQAIYSFRAATVDNILRFPAHFDPPAAQITLSENYRSTQPILQTANLVMSQAKKRYTKDLFSRRASFETPWLVTAEDEGAQVDFVVEKVLLQREQGTALKQQAVLFRTSHHSDRLEVELGKRNVPFVKFGGLKFLEAAHVKDVLCVLRWAENPRDTVAAYRTLQLLPGIGPTIAGRAYQHVEERQWELDTLGTFRAPDAAREFWPALVALMASLRGGKADVSSELHLVRHWYEPHLTRLYESAHVRLGDLDQMEQIAGQYPTRERFLTELTLDPPSASGDESGVPHLDEDYLTLSTIHSAKGQEWNSVYVLNTSDGCIPSDMATGSPEDIEEERRLLYVAMTRAKDSLYLVHPRRFYVHGQSRFGDKHVYAPVSRFITDDVKATMKQTSHGERRTRDGIPDVPIARVDVASRLRQMWN